MPRLLHSFRRAFRGLSVAAMQPNFRIHLLAAAVVALLAVRLRVPAGEGALLALTVGAVLAAEAGNSALEELADAVHPDRHPGVGRAKDVAAAAVLLCAVAALVVGLLVLGPRLWAALSVE